MGRIWINNQENSGTFVSCDELDKLIESHTIYKKEFETPKGNQVVKYFFRIK